MCVCAYVVCVCVCVCVSVCMSVCVCGGKGGVSNCVSVYDQVSACRRQMKQKKIRTKIENNAPQLD